MYELIIRNPETLDLNNVLRINDFTTASDRFDEIAALGYAVALVSDKFENPIEVANQ